MTPRTPTPEFLAWTLALPCELKQIAAWDEPERAERHLRSAREFSLAVREGRYATGRCYNKLAQPEFYFDAAEALGIYGGEEVVRAACTLCPANAWARQMPGMLAGCYGEVKLPQPTESFYRAIDLAVAAARPEGVDVPLVPRTRPAWFGFWLEPLLGERAKNVLAVLEAARVALDDTPEDSWQALRSALSIASEQGIALNARHYPRGWIEGRQWRVAPYCPHCHAEISDYRQPCPACGADKLPMPSLVRFARGTRPWRRLVT